VDRAQFTAEELAAVVDEAHAAGLPVTAHAHALVAIRDAVAAGVDGIEHFTFLTADGVQLAEDVLAAVAARGIVVCPTADLIILEGDPLSDIGALHRLDTTILAGEVVAS
jgi:imidazolonepropionase-like amidohydrolase